MRLEVDGVQSVAPTRSSSEECSRTVLSWWIRTMIARRASTLEANRHRQIVQLPHQKAVSPFCRFRSMVRCLTSRRTLEFSSLSPVVVPSRIPRSMPS